MNKKSIFLSLLLIGGLVTPQTIRPIGGPPELWGAILSCAAAVTTTTLSIGYGVKGYLERHYSAKHCVQNQTDISFYDVILSIEQREKKERKFTIVLTNHSFSNQNYSELIAEVKGYIEHFIEHQLKNVDPQSKLRFTLNTKVTLKTGDTIELKKMQLFKTANRVDQDLVLRTTRLLKIKFDIPSSNWRYQKKTAIFWSITTLPFIGKFIYFIIALNT